MEQDDGTITDEQGPISEAPAETVDELLIEEISIDGMCGVY